MKFQSWLLLAFLAIFVAFAAGIRQGMNVERNNSKFVNYHEVADKKCGVNYLLPDSSTSNLQTVSIICDPQASGAAAMLTKEGYTQVNVASSSGSLKMWMRAPQELQLLIQRSLRYMGDGVK